MSLLVLKKYFTSERSERVKYFSTREEKFRISKRPCNIPWFNRFTTGRILADGEGATMDNRIRMFWILVLENRSQ